GAAEGGAGPVTVKARRADEEAGRFIGKAGRNSEAIRTLVRGASLRDRKRVFVDLASPSLSSPPHFAPRGRRSGGEVSAWFESVRSRGRLESRVLSRSHP